MKILRLEYRRVVAARWIFAFTQDGTKYSAPVALVMSGKNKSDTFLKAPRIFSLDDETKLKSLYTTRFADVCCVSLPQVRMNDKSVCKDSLFFFRLRRAINKITLSDRTT